MKYPKCIETRLPEIQQIVEKWPVTKSLSEVLSWIMQFEPSDYDLAIRIIKSLNVIGPDDLNDALSIAYAKLLRHSKEKNAQISKENTLYVPLGSDGKSGAMIAYNFRMINGLNSAYFIGEDTLDFVNEGKIKNMVLLDDIIATGDQSSKQLTNIAEKARTLGIPNIYVLTAFGFKEGIEKIRATEVADVFAAFEYDEQDTVKSYDAIFYNGLSYERRKNYLEKFSQNYGGYGYGTIGALIAFYYNTPNCSLPIIWNSDNGQIPLFPRKFELKNIGPDLFELDQLIKQQSTLPSVTKSTTLSIYVEGKFEEAFLTELLKSQYNAQQTEIADVISIGPFYSKSLIDALKKYSQKTIFLTTEEEKSTSAHALSMASVIDEDDLLRILPIFSYLDIPKIMADPYFSRVLDPDMFSEDTPKELIYSMLEIRLFKKAPQEYRQENVKHLVENCVDKDRVLELINKIYNKTTEKR